MLVSVSGEDFVEQRGDVEQHCFVVRSCVHERCGSDVGVRGDGHGGDDDGRWAAYR